jgi:hypothetical protein
MRFGESLALANSFAVLRSFTVGSETAGCGPGGATDLNRGMTMFDVQARKGRSLVDGRRSFFGRGGLAAAVASAIALAAPASGLGQNYCVPHPAADGCNLPRVGPHITAASVSHGRLHLTLTFHKAGRFVAHLKRNPPPRPNPTAETGARDLRSANRFRSDSTRRDPGP